MSDSPANRPAPGSEECCFFWFLLGAVMYLWCDVAMVWVCLLWVPTLLGTIAFLPLRRALDEPLGLCPPRAALAGSGR